MANARIAVLASGDGTTAAAANAAWTQKRDGPRIELIISDNPEAGILSRFPDVEQFILQPRNADEVEAFEPDQALHDKLMMGNFDLVWLAGYLKLVGAKIVQQFGWRDEYTSPLQAKMLNTHPGLLPATKGLVGIHVQEYVLAHPGQPAGHTLHVVSEGFDEGPVVIARRVPIEPGDTPQTLFERVKASERQHLPNDIEKFIIDRQNFIKWQIRF